jgi:transposase
VRRDDGRKLDHQTLEALRLRPTEQVARGVPAAEVGAGLAALGLHRRTSYTWLAKERIEGRDALRAKPVPGRRRKLSLAQLIERHFGVVLTVASVGRTLHDLGFSAQRPLFRAEQADPGAVRRWKETDYPTIAAAAQATGGTVFFVDEAGVRSD